jgi:hypothetical protein
MAFEQLVAEAAAKKEKKKDKGKKTHGKSSSGSNIPSFFLFLESWSIYF